MLPALLLVAAAGAATGSTSPPTVTIPGLGAVTGKTLDGGATTMFLGVPFAAAPTGQRRWMPPEPHAGWGGTLNATAFGASCPQGSLGAQRQLVRGADGRRRAGREAIDMGCGRLEDEACLFLNIAAPSAALAVGREPQGPGALPVMIWIHGGGYQEGDSCEYAIDSLAAASGGSVIVSVNCEPSRLPPPASRLPAELNAIGGSADRLGPLGFLGGREVASRTNGGGAGNFGIQGQMRI